MNDDFDDWMMQVYRLSRNGEEALRQAAGRRSVLYDVLFVTSQRLITARKSLVRAASRSKRDRDILNQHGYHITDAEIDYVKELDNGSN